jgi:tripartite-type tricarboxylate transporter receptor subunit TctC
MTRAWCSGLAVNFLAGLGLLLSAPSAWAQDKYPSRPIEFIVPWGAGGGSDQTARALAKLLEAKLETAVPVINAPGGTGTAGITKLLSAAADGYSIGLLAWDTLALLSSKPQKWSIDDLAVLGIVIQLPSALYVAENSRFKTWADVERAAKAAPSAIKVAISGFGSPDHITLNYLATKGLPLKPVPYAEPGERYASVLGGHSDILYSPIGNVRSFVEGKQIRPILMLSENRNAHYKDVTTSKEAGYGITLPQRRAVVVKNGTPPEQLKVLEDALAKVVTQDAYVQFLEREFAQPDSFVADKAAVQLMRADVEQMRSIVNQTQGK